MYIPSKFILMNKIEKNHLKKKIAKVLLNHIQMDFHFLKINNFDNKENSIYIIVVGIFFVQMYFKRIPAHFIYSI